MPTVRQWAFVVGTAAIALVVAALLAPSVLTRLAVPETAEVSWLLGTRTPDGLEFDEPHGYAEGGRGLEELADTLTAMEAAKISAGTSPGALVESASYRFDYGNKGPTVRVYSDGSVQMLIPKSDLRKKSPAGRLWAKLDRIGSETGPYVLYRTEPDPRVLPLVESVHARVQ